ncbi:MAG: cytochrome c biogenesis protein CcsA [Bacteroidales bacterium]|nr:cytochrome c biogenesis protein CcsA [Bacteroidales bacterium]
MMKRPFLCGLFTGLLLIIAGALVTYFAGKSGEIHLRVGESASVFEQYKGGTVEMPFGLRLDKFSIDYYDGGKMPKDFVSEVTVLPSGESRVIRMNHILKRDGYRFFQASYDDDMQGSVLAVSHDPWGTGLVYAGYIILLLSMLFGFFRPAGPFRMAAGHYSSLPRTLRIVLQVLAGVLLVGIFFFICSRLLFKPLMPVLRSPLLWIHVVTIIISYCLFALMFILGFVGVFSSAWTERLRDVSLMALYPGVFLLTFGTIIGSVWANISWGNYWSWDPKETWALITILVYSLALHFGMIKPLSKPRFFHVYAILAFLSVLFTYFGVNFLLGGLHAYS